MEHKQNGSFKLEYPVFTGDRSEELNSLVRDFAMEQGPAGGIKTSSYQADYVCQVTLVNDCVVSMVFCGTGFVDGAAHDFREVVPLNVEIASMEQIPLSKLFDMGGDGFANAAYANGRACGVYWSVPAEDFDELFEREKNEIHDLRHSPKGFLTVKGPVLLSHVGITGVEDLDVLVPLDKLQSFYKYDPIPWEMLSFSTPLPTPPAPTPKPSPTPEPTPEPTPTPTPEPTPTPADEGGPTIIVVEP